MKRVLILWVIVFPLSLMANNIRVVGEVKVLPSAISGGRMASFDVLIEWENSWRDEFNYDAAYLFLKYKYNATDEEWHHLYLGDKVKISGADGIEYASKLISSTGGTNVNEGLMIWRKSKGFGKSSVRLTLDWDILSGDRKLSFTDFNEGKVFLSAMAIEMVYVPRGAFRAGDSQRGTHFHHKYFPIPADLDVVNDNYRFLTKENRVDPLQPPQYAANRFNDINRNLLSNAWVGDNSIDQFWTIDFGEGNKKTIRYIALEGIPAYVPSSWELRGKNSEGASNYVTLLEGVGSDWSIDAHRTYPATKALEIPSPDSYRYYELFFSSLGGAKGPALKTVAMTESDLKSIYDNSVLITEAQTILSAKHGLDLNHLYTVEEDMQSGVTSSVYPNGFLSFFAMKYELSQEQYVHFLNKLNLSQQVHRTTGESLVALEPGQYLFGSTPDQSSYRNGIVLAKRNGLTAPLVFANDLNKSDGAYNLAGDGQSIACNYLTPFDMLAYADWCGLRPLTELEYEKMCREPYPSIPLRGEYAWNSMLLTPSTSLTTASEGKNNETVSSGNVNVNNPNLGPFRCGIFATSSSSQESSGAGFWGIMELSGNLAEIYYNLNVGGRIFSGIPRGSHGDGRINLKTGNSDISSGIWPILNDPFGLRGGSFKSIEKEIEVSDRSRASGVWESGLLNARKEDVGFRLGCSMVQPQLVNVLTLENGLQTTIGTVSDTTMRGCRYTIKCEIPEELKSEYNAIAWFYSSDGSTWELINGESGVELILNNLTDINTVWNGYNTYHYRCEMYSSISSAKSHPVILKVENLRNALTLENGLSNTAGTIGDTVYYKDYVIMGSIPTEFVGEDYTISWYRSIDNGSSWSLLAGENSKDLLLQKVDLPWDQYSVSYYRCEIHSLKFVAKSNPVLIRLDHLRNILTLENGLNTADGSVSDRNDLNNDYLISGHIPNEFLNDSYTIKWFKSTNGSSWSDLIGENKKDLKLKGYSAGHYRCEIHGLDFMAKSLDVIIERHCSGVFVDPRDGQSYKIMLFDNQCWMIENLNIGVFRHSSSDDWTFDEAGIQKWCYNNNTINCSNYGGLYEWWEVVCGGQCNSNVNTSNAGSLTIAGNESELKKYGAKMVPNSTTLVQGICPDGWHIPTDGEWTILGNNRAGWNAQLGGYYAGSWTHLNSYGNWYSSTPYSSNSAWYRYGTATGGASFVRNYFGRSAGFSVRCIGN